MTWARKRLAGGALGPKAEGTPGDLVNPGDVVMVRQVMAKDGNRRWIAGRCSQVPEVQGGFMAMDVNTGRVMAMQGGFSYEDSVFNRATQAARQPGSSFKPFVYAAALDSGFTPATLVVDAPVAVFFFFFFFSLGGGGGGAGGGGGGEKKKKKKKHAAGVVDAKELRRQVLRTGADAHRD